MAIVTDWAEPLEKGLRNQLQQEMNYTEFQDVKKAAEILFGSDPPDDIRRKLDNTEKKFEKRYKEALRLCKEGTISNIRYGIELFRRIGDYQEAKQEIERAERRIKSLERKAKLKKILKYLLIIGVIILAIVLLFSSCYQPTSNVNHVYVGGAAVDDVYVDNTDVDVEDEAYTEIRSGVG